MKGTMKASEVPAHIAVQFRHVLKQTQALGYAVAAVFAFDRSMVSSNDLVWFIAEREEAATRDVCLRAAREALQYVSGTPAANACQAFSLSVSECFRPATCVAIRVDLAECPDVFAAVLLWGSYRGDHLVSEVLQECSSVISSFFVARFGHKSGHQVEWLGMSYEFRRLLEKIAGIGPCDSMPVLISGERGSGKEAVALALHYYSKRRHKTFLTVNCAALTEQLYVSELFGCCKGAYTGADQDRKGKFALANGGTLFLDEITEVPAQLTTALLRALDYGEIQPLGSSNVTRVDVRVIAATNRDIDSMVEQGKFPADVFDRLAALRITVPPLRNRDEDISMLAGYYAQKFCPKREQSGCASIEDCFPGSSRCITEPALEILRKYSWPGNVRELRNVIVQSITAAGGPISPSAIPPQVTQQIQQTHSAPDNPKTLREATRLHIERILHATGGNKSAAARRLGIPLSTLVSKMKKLGVSSC